MQRINTLDDMETAIHGRKCYLQVLGPYGRHLITVPISKKDALDLWATSRHNGVALTVSHAVVQHPKRRDSAFIGMVKATDE